MSILFQALNQAAREYRQQRTSGPLPLLALRPAPLYKKLRARGVFVGLVLLLLGGGAGATFQHTFSPVQASTPVPNLSVSSSDLQPIDKLKQPQRAPHESGIVLPESSLTPSPDDESLVHDVASTIGDAPVLSAQYRHEDDAGSPSFTVNTNDESDAAPEPDAQPLSSDRSIRLVEAKLKQAPDDQTVLAQLAYALEQRGTDADLDRLEELGETYASSAVVYAARGRILARQKDTKEAALVLKRAIELDPDNVANRLSLAVVLDEGGQNKEALAVYRSLPIPLDPHVKARVDFLAQRALVLEAARESARPDDDEE